MVAYSAFVEGTEVCPVGTALACFFAFFQQKFVLKDLILNRIFKWPMPAHHCLVQKFPFSLKFVRAFGIHVIKPIKTIAENWADKFSGRKVTFKNHCWYIKFEGG